MSAVGTLKEEEEEEEVCLAVVLNGFLPEKRLECSLGFSKACFMQLYLSQRPSGENKCFCD